MGMAGLLIVFASYVRQITNFRNRNNPDAGWSSPAPFVGPIFVVAGYSLLPFAFSWWIFIVFVLDPDTIITVISIPRLMWILLRKKSA